MAVLKCVGCDRMFIGYDGDEYNEAIYCKGGLSQKEADEIEYEEKFPKHISDKIHQVSPSVDDIMADPSLYDLEDESDEIHGEIIVNKLDPKFMTFYSDDCEKWDSIVRGLDIIEMIIEDHGLSKIDFAEVVGITPQHLDEILKEDAWISSEVADKIEEYFDYKASILLGIDSKYKQFKKDKGWPK